MNVPKLQKVPSNYKQWSVAMGINLSEKFGDLGLAVVSKTLPQASDATAGTAPTTSGAVRLNVQSKASNKVDEVLQAEFLKNKAKCAAELMIQLSQECRDIVTSDPSYDELWRGSDCIGLWKLIETLFKIENTGGNPVLNKITQSAERQKLSSMRMGQGESIHAYNRRYQDQVDLLSFQGGLEKFTQRFHMVHIQR
jgi:hypothetical protein